MTLNELFKNTTYDDTLFSDEAKSAIESRGFMKVVRGNEVPYIICAIRNKEIKLTQTEYNILALLSENSGKMMTYAAIIKAIWGEIAQEGSIKKLQVNMANIRKKLGDKPGEQNYIANELGVGYRLNV